MTSLIDQENPQEISFPCVEVNQNIGTYYSGVISAKDLIAISWADVRRLQKEKRGFESYLGIQRPLDEKRVNKIADYVKTKDSCFPTGVILSIPGRCVEFSNGRLVVRNYFDPQAPEDNVIFGKVASVLDGQHRIEGMRVGLSEAERRDFLVPVSIFVDIDLAEQAYIFSTVNLAQTKVSKSLVYDLFDLAESPSPQKLAHNVAVILDRFEGSPLEGRIKRLGSATPGRFNETITQAAFVEALLAYVSTKPEVDRDIYLRGKTPERADANQLNKLIFRNMMIEGREADIAEVVLNYFSAVRAKWPSAWVDMGRGTVLNKTNGFKALMKFLRPAYLHLANPGKVLKEADFTKVFDGINLVDSDFVVERYPPGTSGQARIFQDLMAQSGLDAR